MAGHATDPLHEVQDHDSKWVFFEELFGGVSWDLSPFSFEVAGYRFQLTKFMILELIAALLILLIFLPLARKIREGGLPKGRFWNLFEGLLLFVRDDICRPNLDGVGGHPEHHEPGPGEPAHSQGRAIDARVPAAVEAAEHAHGHHAPAEDHPGDRFLPFLWTLFLFVLFC